MPPRGAGNRGSLTRINGSYMADRSNWDFYRSCVASALGASGEVIANAINDTGGYGRWTVEPTPSQAPQTSAHERLDIHYADSRQVRLAKAKAFFQT